MFLKCKLHNCIHLKPYAVETPLWNHLILFILVGWGGGQISWIDSYLSAKNLSNMNHDERSSLILGWGLKFVGNSWAKGTEDIYKKRVTMTMIDSKVITTEFHSCAMQMLNILCAIDNIWHLQVPTDIPKIHYAMVVIS